MIGTHTIAFDEILADTGLAFEQGFGKGLAIDKLENGLGLLTLENTAAETINTSFAAERLMMYFFFNIEGESHIHESIGNKLNAVNENQFLFFAYPLAEATLSTAVAPGAKLVIALISLEKLHELFKSESGERLSFDSMARSYKQKEPMVQGIVTPYMLVALHQLAATDMNESFRKLYRKGKILEFFSLYMDQSRRAAEGKNECPYIANEMDIDRIHQARIILANNMGNPPSLPDLARQSGINEFKLKVGFKQVYGNTVYGYLNELRMETARRMLDTRKHQVKEIAFAIGYNNPSHFISAFKKKFGVTPSKYMER